MKIFVLLMCVAFATLFTNAQEINLSNFEIKAENHDVINLMEIQIDSLLLIQEPVVFPSGVDENLFGIIMRDEPAGNPPKVGVINMNDLHFVLKIFLDGQEIVIKPDNTEFNAIVKLDDLVQVETAGDAQIPEPSAAILIGAGIIPLFRRRRLS